MDCRAFGNAAASAPKYAAPSIRTAARGAVNSRQHVSPGRNKPEGGDASLTDSGDIGIGLQNSMLFKRILGRRHAPSIRR
jgi:hypothetical protein